MLKFRQLLTILFVCSVVFISGAHAQSTLTEIRDTVTNSNGSPFNGTVVITWNGYANPGTVSPLSTSASIYNGALSVLLVPTTTATAGAYYQVVYNSSDGTVTWSEIWQVPPSATPLTIAQVRQSSTQAGSGPGSSPPSGPGGSTGQYATIPIPISEISGLSSDLAAINGTINALAAIVNGTGSLASIQTQVNNLTTTVNGLSANVTVLNNEVASLNSMISGSSEAVFVDAETPSGTVNGTNTAFNLANTPSPAASLEIYRNGLVQTNGVDYTLSGMTITFQSGSIPLTGDLLQAYYRMAGTAAPASFSDDETPGGNINGTNLTFTLATAPAPPISLKLYKNGLLLTQNVDYTISGSTITFANTTVTPKSGDLLTAYYRH